jgi:hypothetical protein
MTSLQPDSPENPGLAQIKLEPVPELVHRSMQQGRAQAQLRQGNTE